MAAVSSWDGASVSLALLFYLNSDGFSGCLRVLKELNVNMEVFGNYKAVCIRK